MTVSENRNITPRKRFYFTHVNLAVHNIDTATQGYKTAEWKNLTFFNVIEND